MVARHLVSAVAVLLVVTFATFLLLRSTPGNTATSIAVRQAGPGASQEQVDRLHAELRLDSSLPVQYGVWLGRAVQGDLGRSDRSGRTVTDEIAAKAPRTLFLGLGAAVIALVVGFGAGVLSAVDRRGGLAAALRVGALAAVSIPTFWMSFLLIVLLSEQLRWLPTSGDRGFASWIMPWVVLALPAAGAISRVVSVSLTETMSRQHVTAARARGAPGWSVVLRDGLPHAAGATLNVTAMHVGMLLTGSVIVETVFAWPGLGAWFVDSVKFRDNGAVLGGVLVFALAFILITRGIDVVQKITDPRLRKAEVGA
ncbi:MAG: ABC transporter permease [Micrococcales bacterium]|nr:ABC transporter permease [Micrococcales bacterium]